LKNKHNTADPLKHRTPCQIFTLLFKEISCTGSFLYSTNTFFFFFQALNHLVESFGLLNDLFPLPTILGAGYPVFDLHLADILFDVILPSVLGVLLVIFYLEVSN
jgi:hypothetical protein